MDKSIVLPLILAIISSLQGLFGGDIGAGQVPPEPALLADASESTPTTDSEPVQPGLAATTPIVEAPSSREGALGDRSPGETAEPGTTEPDATEPGTTEPGATLADAAEPDPDFNSKFGISVHLSKEEHIHSAPNEADKKYYHVEQGTHIITTDNGKGGVIQRVELYPKEKFNGVNSKKTFEAQYHVVSGTYINLFQVKESNAAEPLFMLTMDAGNLRIRHTEQDGEPMQMGNKPFSLKMVEDGKNYELSIDGKVFASGTYRKVPDAYQIRFGAYHGQSYQDQTEPGRVEISNIKFTNGG
jgi:hypothetical protein